MSKSSPQYLRLRPVLRMVRGSMLRTRLLLGTLTTLVIFFAAALYSIHTFQMLEEEIGGFIDRNFRLARTLERIQEASRELSAALVLRLAGEVEQSAAIFESNVETLEAARKTIDEDFDVFSAEVREKLIELAGKIDLLLGEAEILYTIDGDDFRSEDMVRLYARELSPLILEISGYADELRELNDRNIAGRSDSSREVTLATIRFLLFAMIVATVLVLYFTYRLSYSVLSPLRRLTHSVRQLGSGKLDQDIPVFSRDEIGALANSLNHLARDLKQYQRETADKLARMHRTMEMTLATFPHPVFIVGVERNLEFLNPPGKKLLREHGLSEDGRVPDSLNLRIERAIAEGRNFNPYRLTEALRFVIDGRDRFFIPRILLLRDEDEKIFGVALVLDDVTNLRLLDEMKTNLVATVSHELKTPLTGIRMSLHMLVDRCHSKLSEDETDLLRTAHEDTEKLYHTLNNLLDLTRVEEAETALNLRPWDPKENLSSVIEKAVGMFPASEVTVDLDLHDDLPELWLDPERIEHVFINLLTNALKYSERGGHVLVRGRRLDNGGARFSVIDTGPGISPEHRERVFDKFYRVPGEGRPGAGVGLAIARKLAELHGARLDVASEPGNGSEFFIDFPPPEPRPTEPVSPAGSGTDR